MSDLFIFVVQLEIEFERLPDLCCIYIEWRTKTAPGLLADGLPLPFIDQAGVLCCGQEAGLGQDRVPDDGDLSPEEFFTVEQFSPHSSAFKKCFSPAGNVVTVSIDCHLFSEIGALISCSRSQTKTETARELGYNLLAIQSNLSSGQ